MIVFENEGEIDIRSVCTFGISVKTGENPIGFFGTGLKYAIAVLLRSECKIAIYSGLELMEFSLKRDTVRGKEFEFVTVKSTDGTERELGFTTELGKQWDLWMAYREIACNTRDEKGDVSFEFGEIGDVLPEAGKTKIVVKGDAFESVFANRTDYLLDDTADLKIGALEIRNRPSQAYFYRDVRVMPLAKPCMYMYNDTERLELTEDRAVKYQWLIPGRIASAYLQCEDEAMLRRIITASDDYFEHDLDFDTSAKPSDAFLSAVEACQLDRVSKINTSAIRAWSKATQKQVYATEIELTEVQKKMLEKALSFCGKIGFPVRGSYPISFVEALGDGCLGMAKDGVIYISEKSFQIGTKNLAGTLIEEYIHLRHDLKDCTRNLQNFFLDKMVSLGEELIGEPL